MAEDRLYDDYDVDITYANGESPTSNKLENEAEVLQGRISKIEGVVGDVTEESMDPISDSRHQVTLSRILGDYAQLSPSYTDNVPIAGRYRDNPSVTITVPSGVREFMLDLPASHPTRAAAFSSTSDALQTLVSDTPSAEGEFTVIDNNKVVTYSVINNEALPGDTLTYRFYTEDANRSIPNATPTVIPTTYQFDTTGEGVVLEAWTADFYRVGFAHTDVEYKYDEDGNTIPSTARESSTSLGSSNKLSYRLPDFYSNLGTGFSFGVTGASDNSAVGDPLPGGLLKLYDTTPGSVGFVSDVQFYLGRNIFEVFISVTSAPTVVVSSTRYLLVVGQANTVGNTLRELIKRSYSHAHTEDTGGSRISHSDLINLMPISGTGATRSAPSIIPGNDHPQYLNRTGYTSGDAGNHKNEMYGDLHIPSTTHDGLEASPPYNYDQNSGITHKVTYGDNTTGVAHYGCTVGSDWRLQYRGDLDGGGDSNLTGLFNFSGAEFLPVVVLTRRGHARNVSGLRVYDDLSTLVTAINAGTFLHGVRVLIEGSVLDHEVSSDLTVSYSNIHFEGVSNAVQLVSRANLNYMLRFTGDNCSILRVGFRCGLGTTVQSAIYCTGDNTRVYDCIIDDSSGTLVDGITLNGDGARLVHNSISGHTSDGIVATASSSGYNHILHNDISGPVGSPVDGIDTDSGNGHYFITGNSVTGTHNRAIQATYTDSSVFDNYISGATYGLTGGGLVRNNTISANTGIYFGSSLATQQISGNKIAFTVHGISGTSITNMAKICDNTITSTTGGSIGIHFSGTVTEASFANNQIESVSDCIYCGTVIGSTNSFRVIFDTNTLISSGGAGIAVGNSNENCTGAIFDGNNITSAASCIQVDGYIMNCRFGTNNLYIDGSATTNGCIKADSLSYCTLNGNEFHTDMNPLISVTGDWSYVTTSGNLFHRTATAGVYDVYIGGNMSYSPWNGNSFDVIGRPNFGIVHVVGSIGRCPLMGNTCHVDESSGDLTGPEFFYAGAKVVPTEGYSTCVGNSIFNSGGHAIVVDPAGNIATQTGYQGDLNTSN